MRVTLHLRNGQVKVLEEVENISILEENLKLRKSEAKKTEEKEENKGDEVINLNADN